MAPSYPYTAWTIGQTRAIVRRELTDLAGRWWTDPELDRYIEAWQNELQQRFEFVWGSSTQVTALSTQTIASYSPAVLRLDAVYWNGYRLSGRLWQQANELIYNWQNVNGTVISNPQLVYQRDAQTFILWPQLTTSGTLTLEYPRKLSIGDDTSTLSVPAWAQWTAKYYCAWRAYLRLGPNNDLRRAQRYKAKYERSCLKLREFYDHFMPERYRRLKLGQKYEYDILCPQPSIDVVAQTITSAFTDFNSASGTVSGTIDGLNTMFSIPVVPNAQKVFVNGLYQEVNVNYTIAGSVLTFTVPPPVDSLIVVLVYLGG